MSDETGTKGRLRALLALAMCAVAVIGCGGGPTRTCQQSGSVELCLIENGPAYKVTGKGFQGESEVVVSLEDDGRPAGPAAKDMPPVRVGADGVLPAPGGVLSALKGPVLQRLTVRGKASDGSTVEFRFTIPAQAT